jgi:uncharacterized membrane protein required for colicin V production
LEKVIIFAIVLMVLIYTVAVAPTPPQSQNKTVPISTQPPPDLKPVSKKEAGFFPESVPNPDDESIIEETFTEVP